MAEQSSMDVPQEEHLAVQRTARYYRLGGGGAVATVWFVLHGYGQLARYFVRPFRAFATAERLVVAPEALSRFYLHNGGANRRVGATWMTREDRLREMEDYVAYLDALAEQVLDALDPTPAVDVLGFSQGVATAVRWAVRGRTHVRRLVAWGGGLPDEVPVEALRRFDLSLVAGADDEYVTPAHVAALRARLDAAGVAYGAHTFDGGHRLDGATLAAVMGG